MQNDFLRILLAEDSSGTLENYSHYFRRYYTNFVATNDGLDAFKQYKSFQPNVIFLDISLPTLNGIEVLKMIRKEDQSTKIIIFSAYSEESFIEQALQEGADHYLIKPVSRQELTEVLDKLEKHFINIKG